MATVNINVDVNLNTRQVLEIIDNLDQKDLSKVIKHINRNVNNDGIQINGIQIIGLHNINAYEQLCVNEITKILSKIGGIQNVYETLKEKKLL